MSERESGRRRGRESEREGKARYAGTAHRSSIAEMAGWSNQVVGVMAGKLLELRVAALPPARHTCVDQTRVSGAQIVRPDPQTLADPGAEGLDEHVS